MAKKKIIIPPPPNYIDFLKTVLVEQFGEKLLNKNGSLNKSITKTANFKSLVFGNRELTAKMVRRFDKYNVSASESDLKALFSFTMQVGALNKGVAQKLADYVDNFELGRSLLGVNLSMSAKIETLEKGVTIAQNTILQGWQYATTPTAKQFFADFIKDNPILFPLNYYSKWSIRDINLSIGAPNVLATFGVPTPEKIVFEDFYNLNLIDVSYSLITQPTQIDKFLDSVYSAMGSEDIVQMIQFFNGTESEIYMILMQ